MVALVEQNTIAAEGARDALAERLFQATLATWDIATVFLGHRLGLYGALAGVEVLDVERGDREILRPLVGGHLTGETLVDAFGGGGDEKLEVPEAVVQHADRIGRELVADVDHVGVDVLAGVQAPRTRRAPVRRPRGDRGDVRCRSSLARRSSGPHARPREDTL